MDKWEDHFGAPQSESGATGTDLALMPAMDIMTTDEVNDASNGQERPGEGCWVLPADLRTCARARTHTHTHTFTHVYHEMKHGTKGAEFCSMPANTDTLLTPARGHVVPSRRGARRRVHSHTQRRRISKA